MQPNEGRMQPDPIDFVEKPSETMNGPSKYSMKKRRMKEYLSRECFKTSTELQGLSSRHITKEWVASCKFHDTSRHSSQQFACRQSNKHRSIRPDVLKQWFA
jgi:hypothetical protein